MSESPPQEYMKSHTIEYEGKKISYKVRGTGAPIFLLHGYCVDSSIWDEFVPELSKFKIIRPDFSGFGGSELIENYSIENLARTIKAIVDDLKIEKCIFIGHSMGGYVALALAELFPKVVQGLCLFHSHCFADSDEKKIERQRSIDFINKNGHFVYVKQLIPNLFADLFTSSNNFLMNSLIYKASSFSPKSLICALQAMKERKNYENVLAHLKSPVCLIIGKIDKRLPFEVSEKMLLLNPVTDVHILPKVAHMGMFTAREYTARAITQFSELCKI